MRGWRMARRLRGGDDRDPVFLAVRDARALRFRWQLLDELVAGVTMDLDRGTGERMGAPDTYATFADLYRYCYLVASVVGLVCIRIFGYTDPRAEKLAEETGIAFQLTNILRDVAEDAARNRVYLPLEDLAAHKFRSNRCCIAPGAPPTANERALLAEIASARRSYYRSAQALLPLIDRESRPRCGCWFPSITACSSASSARTTMSSCCPAIPRSPFPITTPSSPAFIPSTTALSPTAFSIPRRRSLLHVRPQTVTDGSWYGGVPLWSLAESQGMRTACLLWVGCEAKIAGFRPSYYALRRQNSGHARVQQARIDDVLALLHLPAADRPHFIAIYYSEPDHEGHEFGPDAPRPAPPRSDGRPRGQAPRRARHPACPSISSWSAITAW
jgi:hypothetical protein